MMTRYASVLSLTCICVFVSAGFAQRVPFDSLIANTGSNKSIVWTTSTYQNGYGHRLYGLDAGGKTDLRFAARQNSTTWTDIMTITSTGNVGFGTTTPSDRIEIAGTVGSIKYDFSGARIAFTRNSANYIDALGSGGFLIFSTGGAQERVRIDSAGKVGIGIRNPAAPLHVGGGSYTNQLSQFANNSTLRVDVANPAISVGIGYSSTDNPTLQAFNNVNNVANNLLINPFGGNVVIGDIDPKGYKLAVAGSMIAERVRVKVKTAWPDYVFAAEYRLPPLAEVASYIKTHQRLPDMPAADEVQQDGIDLGEMNRKLLQKVEELTLYMLQLDRQNRELKAEVEQLKAGVCK